MKFILIAAIAFLATTTAAHACTNPTGVKGEIIMNGTHNIPSYCDGTNWIGMAGGAPPVLTTNTQIVPSGLIVHWRMDETNGNTANDSSGNGNHGTISRTDAAALTTTGAIGRAFSFEKDNDSSTSDGITGTGIPAGLAQSFTVSFWAVFYPDADLLGVPLGTGTVVDIDSPNAARIYRRTAEKIRWSVNGTNHEFIMETHMRSWRLYTFTSDGYNFNMYVNGVLARTQNYPGGITTTGAFEIGHTVGAFGGTPKMEMDDFRIYNRVLTESEMLTLVQARDGIRYNEREENGIFRRQPSCLDDPRMAGCDKWPCRSLEAG